MVEMISVNKKNSIFGLLIVASFLFCYAKVMLGFVKVWGSNDTYSFGFIIPLISLYILWERREKIVNSRVEPSITLGIPILFLALFTFRLGEISGVVLLRDVSFLIGIIGLVYYLFGNDVFRNAWFPITYLIFMIPIWDLLFGALHFPFQMFSANMGVKLLQLFGIPSYRSGIFIELPNITLQVAEVCSGVNYLLSIIALGIPLSYLYISKTIKRIAVISAAVLISIISNGIRIALIGVLAYQGYRELHGPFGMFRAVFISTLGYIILFILVWVLADKKDKNRETKRETIKAEKKHLMKKHKNNKLKFLHTIIISTIFITIGGFPYNHKANAVPLKSDFKFFPYKVGKWTGMNVEPDFDVFQRLGADDQLSRRYKSESGHTVNLYIGYFEFQEQRKELINNQMMYFFKNNSNEIIHLGKSKSISINTFLLDEGDNRKLVYYWFDINGRIVNDKYLVKLYSAWDGIFHNRTNGSIVLITTDFLYESSKKSSSQVVVDFINEIFPVVDQFLPQGLG